MKIARTAGLIAVLCLLLLPTLANAAPPAPKGNLVLEDDFSTKKSGLEDQLDAKDYSRGFHAPGVYHLKDVQPNTTNWQLLPSHSFGEFSFQIDLWDNSDDVTAGDLAGGIVFRATDQNHLYALFLDSRKGDYAVRKLNGANTWSDIVAETASPLVKRKNDVNQVRVDGEGSTFTIYLNGEKLTNFNDSSYAKGSVGFISHNIDAVGNHIHFDNLKIWSTEAASTTTTAPGGLPPTGATNSEMPLSWFVAVALLLLGVGLWLRHDAR